MGQISQVDVLHYFLSRRIISSECGAIGIRSESSANSSFHSVIHNEITRATQRETPTLLAFQQKHVKPC